MIVNRLLKLPIRVWHRFIAPAFPPACRFYPSCAVYALDALDHHPWPRALWLIAWRLMRCHPFCRGGYDPVPGTDAEEDQLRDETRRRRQHARHKSACPHGPHLH